MKTNILILVCVILLNTSCNNNSKSEKSENDLKSKNVAFGQLLQDYHEDGLKLNPLFATMMGFDKYNDSFPNFLSDEYQKEIKAYYSGYLEKLSQFTDNELSETEKISKAILNWECEINLEGLTYREDLFPIDQTWSVNLLIGQWAFGAAAQPFKSVNDYNKWLERLEGYLVWMSSAEKKMKEGMELDYILPKSLIKKVIPQMEALADDDVEKHLFYNPIKNFPDSFSAEEKSSLTEAYTKIIAEKIIPAYKSIHQFMSTEYLKAGRETSGITNIPNGKAYYEYQRKKYTTTNLSSDEIFEIGLNEVKRILSEMEKVKVEVGYQGDLISFFNHVRNNKDLMPFTDAQQVLDNFNSIHDKMKPQLEKLFDLTPKASFEVRRTEAFREKSASAQYNVGSLDGTRPGIFYTPIPDVTKYNTFTDESLFLHEAIPGHHYQISLMQENENLPQFRRVLWYSGYGEGWALYTESLGKELGLYTDPYQYLGMLSMEIHRAIRLVVDVGIHAKGWTREQAIQYSLENEAESEATIISEIERYMANPGQALSYKIGQLKIRELRSKAEKELGDQFDIRQFHNHVLETGCVPLSILEDKINEWIAISK